ncbi:MAG: c-type cytochrome, partial [Planctomycetaceae bacterium]
MQLNSCLYKCPGLAVWLAFCLVLFVHPPDSACADETVVTVQNAPASARGQQIYQERCISCHGINGQGTP